MNKKRFKYEYGWIWNENGEKFDVNECEGQRLVCDKLNEQQATIEELESDKAIAEDYANIFEMENVKLRKKCGESDSENAKLRLKNKELQEEIKLLKPVNIEQYEQIVQLQEENEQLKNRLNKEYIKECSI